MYDSNDRSRTNAPQRPTGELPPYKGAPVKGGNAYTPKPVDPLLTSTFLPPAAPRRNGANAPLGPDYTNAPDFAAHGNAPHADQYANAPDNDYANLPDFSQSINMPDANHYANVPDMNPYANIPTFDDAAVASVDAQQQPAPRVRRPLPPLPDTPVYTGDGVDRIVIETNDRSNPQNANTRTFRALGASERFEGHIVMTRENGEMLMRPVQSGQNGQETLVHLPPSALQQFRDDGFAEAFIKESISKGVDGKPLEISYQKDGASKGQWSMKHPKVDYTRTK